MISRFSFWYLCVFVILLSLCAADNNKINIDLVKAKISVVVEGSWGEAVGQFGLEIIEDMGNAPSGPSSFCLDATGNIFVGDGVNNRIQQFDSTGNFVKSISLVQKREVPIRVTAIVCDRKGRIFIADSKNRNLLVFNKDGKLLKEIHLDLHINNLRINSADNILIVDHNKRMQFNITEEGEIIDTFSDNVFVEKDKIWKIINKGKEGGRVVLKKNNENRDKIADTQFKVNVDVDMADYLFAGVDSNGNIYVVAVPYERNYEFTLVFNANGVLKKVFKRDFQFWTIDKRCYFIDKEGCFYAMNSSNKKFWVNKYVLK